MAPGLRALLEFVKNRDLTSKTRFIELNTSSMYTHGRVQLMELCGMPNSNTYMTTFDEKLAHISEIYPRGPSDRKCFIVQETLGGCCRCVSFIQLSYATRFTMGT